MSTHNEIKKRLNEIQNSVLYDGSSPFMGIKTEDFEFMETQLCETLQNFESLKNEEIMLKARLEECEKVLRYYQTEKPPEHEIQIPANKYFNKWDWK